MSRSPKDDLITFGGLVRERRKSEGWTQETLADKALGNVNRSSYISDVENGKQNLLPSSTLSIANALRVKREEIPESLRWPESKSVTTDAIETINKIHEIVAELEERDKARRSSPAAAQADTATSLEHYLGRDPDEFSRFLAHILNDIERAQTLNLQDKLGRSDSQAYDRLLAKLANIELSIAERKWTARAKKQAISATLLILVSLIIVLAFWQEILFRYYKFSIWAFRPVNAVERLMLPERYFLEPGISRTHNELAEYEGRQFNRGRGFDSDVDARAAEGLLSTCIDPLDLDLSALDLRRLSFDSVQQRCGRLDVSDVDFRAAIFPSGELPAAANLARSDFSGSVLIGVNFGNADIFRSVFDCADISGANFSRVRNMSPRQLDGALCGFQPENPPLLPSGHSVPEGCRWMEEPRVPSLNASAHDSPVNEEALLAFAACYQQRLSEPSAE